MVNFMTPVVWRFFSFGKSNLRFPLYQATGYGHHPVGGSTSGHEIFKILIFKFKLEEKLFKEMPHFERTPSKNVSSLEHPLFCISLQIFRRIFQFNDPTISPPASFLPSRDLPPSPATKTQSHPANLHWKHSLDHSAQTKAHPTPTTRPRWARKCEPV